MQALLVYCLLDFNYSNIELGICSQPPGMNWLHLTAGQLLLSYLIFTKSIVSLGEILLSGKPATIMKLLYAKNPSFKLK